MINEKFDHRNKTIAWLIGALNEISSTDFKKNSLQENKTLLKKVAETFDFIHGKRSEGIPNYYPIKIETEILSINFNLRRFMLKQIMQMARKNYYDDKKIKECWDDFIFAYNNNYGELAPHNCTWSSHGLAAEAFDLLFKVISNKLKTALSRGLEEKTKDQYMKMLSGLLARSTPNSQNYKTIEKIMNIFDPQGKYNMAWV